MLATVPAMVPATVPEVLDMAEEAVVALEATAAMVAMATEVLVRGVGLPQRRIAVMASCCGACRFVMFPRRTAGWASPETLLEGSGDFVSI